jgi:molybdopterin synthase catalytic subunit
MFRIHRTGIVEVEDPSAAIAVASPHRDAAFAGCRLPSEELKHTLLVGKKEVSAGGHDWTGQRS